MALALVMAAMLMAAGGDSPAGCGQAGDTALLVSVTGLRDTKGDVSVELHPDMEGDYLGTLLSRARLKAGEADKPVCLEAPGPGRYIIVVLHDRNENGKLDILSDGFGFSRNPEIGLSMPKRGETATDIGEGVTATTVLLKYVQGLSARPFDAGQAGDTSRRRMLHKR